MAGIRDVTRRVYLRIRGRLPREPPLPTPKPPLPAPTSPEPPEPSPLPLATYTGHGGNIFSIAFLPDSAHVVSGSIDGSMRVWSLTDGHEVGETIEIGSPVRAVAASEDGKLLASGGADGKITLWDAKSHKKVVEGEERHLEGVNSLAVSCDSTRVASASDDKSVIVWSTSTGERLAGPFTGHTGGVLCVAFSPDAERLATCDANTICIWHSRITELALPPIQTANYDSGANSLSWTPDGNQIIAGCLNKSIQIFDALNGSRIARRKAHTENIWSIAISHDG
ncbi:hypothetical protein HYDPIDRAFT_100440, partial [Hydnomerulius pinastri MD-312]